METGISIVIVDDHPLFREGVRSTLSHNDAFNVVAEGANAEDALRLAQDHLPEMLLLDIAMPGGGIAAARTVSAACPITKIVMLTVSEDEDNVMAALKAGAKGYILKGVAGNELRSNLISIKEGEVFITPSLAVTMLVDLVEEPKSSSSSLLDELTQRERQILNLVAEGQTNKAMAAELGISIKTVKHYMSNILAKLQVKNRVEAALVAYNLK